MGKKAVLTDKAPAPGGPYSQGIVANGFVFVAGQVGKAPGAADYAGNDVQSQTRQTLENVKAILEAAGSGLEHVVKTTVFLQNVDDFRAMNEVYATFFTSVPPARSTIEVARLPGKGALVEIEAVAIVP